MSELQMTPDEREYWRRMEDPTRIVHIMPSAINLSVLGTTPLRWTVGLLRVLEMQQRMDRFTNLYWKLPLRKLSDEQRFR